MLDDALVPIEEAISRGIKDGLNPCCAGRCPSTQSAKGKNDAEYVSILVVLDDALVQLGFGLHTF